MQSTTFSKYWWFLTSRYRRWEWYKELPNIVNMKHATMKVSLRLDPDKHRNKYLLPSMYKNIYITYSITLILVLFQALINMFKLSVHSKADKMINWWQDQPAFYLDQELEFLVKNKTERWRGDIDRENEYMCTLVYVLYHLPI